MTTKKRATKKRRPLSKEAQTFADAFGAQLVGAGVVADVTAQQEGAREESRPVHVVLDNTIPGGFRMEPV